MKKIVSYTAFLITLVAGSLLATPAKANTIKLEKLAQLDRNSPELALISSPGDRNSFDAANNFNSADNFNKIIGITGLGLGTGAIAYRLSRAGKPSLANSSFDSNNNSLLLDRVSPKLRQKLLRLVHNKQTANRLLRGTMLGHADRPPNWLAEKVIYDLERDRV